MECQKCKKSAAIELSYLEPLCNKCFCGVIEKRIRKYCRLNHLFEKNDAVLVLDNLGDFVLKRIIGGLPVRTALKEISVSNILNNDKEAERFVSEKKINKIFLPWTADDEACEFLYEVFNNKIAENKNDKPLTRICAKPFLHVTNNELDIYAKIHNLNFNPNNLFPDVKHFLDSLEKFHPDTKFGLIKSRQLIDRLR